MTTQTKLYRHSLTGKVAEMTPDSASVFPEYLYEVPAGSKPFVPGLFKPGKVGEFDNPEPLTDEQITASALVEATSDHPYSKAAKEAKADLAKADEAADPEGKAE